MAKAIATTGRSAPGALIARMAAKAGIEPAMYVATIKKTLVPKGEISNEQLAACLSVADQYGLDPFTKEIFFFPAKGGGIAPVLSVDGWATLINRQPNMDGLTFDDAIDEGGNLVAITARIYRKDRSHPTEVTEYMAECVRDTDVWRKWPRRMLRHKALIQCARIAFGLSGLYDQDEAERGDIIDITPPAAPSPPSPAGRPARNDRRQPEPEPEAEDSTDDAVAEALADGDADGGEKTILDEFREQIGMAKSVAAVDRIWNAFADRMPEDDAAFTDTYRRRINAIESGSRAA